MPGTLRITEINFHIRGHCKGLVLGHLQSAIPGQRAAQEIALSMTRYSAVLNFSGPFPDGDGSYDLTTRVPKDTRALRTAYAAHGPEMSNQLLFQRSPRLNEQATVNGLVGHAQALVIGILGLQPSGDPFRRPVQQQFTATVACSFSWKARRQGFGRKADFQAWASASLALALSAHIA
jgi:hypothetical protein